MLSIVPPQSDASELGRLPRHRESPAFVHQEGAEGLCRCCQQSIHLHPKSNDGYFHLKEVDGRPRGRRAPKTHGYIGEEGGSGVVSTCPPY